MAAVRDLVEDRHAEFEVFGSDEAWRPWFQDVAGDHTLLRVDRGKFEITLVCITDTD